MVKRSKILGLLFLTSLLFTSFNNIDVNANGGMDFGEGFDILTTKRRPEQGYINAGDWNQNPEFPKYNLDANGRPAKYSRSKTKVVSKKISRDYGYDVYFYYPDGYDSILYAVPENRYAKWSTGTFRPRYTYGYNYNESLYSIAPTNYRKTYKNTEWRYLGYNMDGNPIENPYFQPDALFPDQHNLGTSRLVSGNIHNRNVASGSIPYVAKYVDEDGVLREKRVVVTTEFDESEFRYDKLDAIKRLINIDPSLRNPNVYYQNSSREFNKWTLSTNTNTLAAQWAEILSLQSHPVYESPLFKGWNGAGYYASAVAPAHPDIDKSVDLGVLSIKVTEGDGTIVGYGWRTNTYAWKYKQYKNISPNRTYNIEYAVRNHGDADSTINPTSLVTGFAINDNVSNNPASEFYPNNNADLTKTLSQDVTVKANSTIIYTRKVVTPTNLRNGWQVTAYIPSSLESDNSRTDNDAGHIIFKNIELADVAAHEIKFVDINGNETDKIIPGNDYKIKLSYKYTGPTLDRYSGYTCRHEDGTSHWVDTSDPPIDLYFSADVERYYPQTLTSDSKKYNFSKTGIWPENGEIFTFYTDYITFEQPKVTVTSSVSGEVTWVNSNSENDALEKTYNDIYNYKVENLKILNGTMYPLKNGNINVGISYDIVLEAPTHNTKEFDVETEINLNGKKVYVTDHVKNGRTSITRNVTMNVNALTSGSSNYPISVKTNSNKKKWEKDLSSQSDNSKTAYLTVKAPIKPSDIFGMSKNEGKSWSKTHSKNTYYGLKKTYSSFLSKSFSFYNYGRGTKSIETKGYSDSYKIEKVLFKSKFTTDKKYGSNGWVDLLNPSQKNLAKIKAGYGYELEIIVAYKTNALSTQPKETRYVNASQSSGTTVSNLNTPANINNDIYVRTSDGKILSATGANGTIQAFNSSVISQTDDVIRIKYTMKTKSLNNKVEPMKILISEDAKDGTYKLDIATPLSNGVGITGESRSNILSKESVYFKVQGSMLDDAIDSIVQ